MLKESQPWRSARSVALYASMPRELNLSSLISAAFEDGKRVFLPRVISKARSEMRMLEVQPGEIEEWTPNSWGIREPPDDGRNAAPDDTSLDLVVVPGIAFASDGRRCGHGGGFYDTFLSRCEQKQSQRPHIIALALAVQMVADVPTDKHDFIVDQVIAVPNK